MKKLKNTKIIFNLELKNIKKQPTSRKTHARNFIYEFDVYVNKDIILKGLNQGADSIDEIKKILIKDFKRGIKKIY